MRFLRRLSSGKLSDRQQYFADECAGILRGRVTADFVGIGVVEITLTEAERGEYLAALISSQNSWWGCSIAHYLSPELEDVLCGWAPERYTPITARVTS